MDDADRFIKKFLDLAIERFSANKLNHTDAACLIFPGTNKEEAVRKWRRIRNISKNGKAQALTFSDAHDIAKALGTDISVMCLEVRELLKLEITDSNTNRPSGCHTEKTNNPIRRNLA
jgi:hypothetical protein